MEPLVIIGTGLAGYSLAREFRKHDTERPMLMLTADDGAYYSKPMLSTALDKGQHPDDLVLADAAAMAAKLNADIRPLTRVTALDPGRQCLRTGQDDIRYGDLVLALGADPIRLALTGDAADDVLSVNDRNDYARLRQHLAGKQRVVILGGGLIGCEFANDLRRAGFEVTLVDLAATLLPRLLPPQAAAALQRGLEAVGVEVRLGRAAAAIDREQRDLCVTLDDGAQLHADVVLSAVGLRPRTNLAASAGLRVERGIVTDRHLRTSEPHIFALGDCAEVAGLNLPYVMPLMAAARALGATLAASDDGQAVRYPAMPVVVKTPDCPTVVCPPMAGGDDDAGEWHEQPRGDGVRALFQRDDGQVLGFALVGAEAVQDKQRLTAQLSPWLA